ncbi:uncharacterized protein LOC143465393 isoform X1 [Clavelina lepadiformis]|uniref:Lens fiber membrane intrinsic protein n=1 Tax=Clavelina lepadiformis TaxID=159417 RepID=A0ABP0EXU2_CLALP
MKHYFGFVIFPVSAVALFIDAVAIGTANWANSGTSTETSQGLWQNCALHKCATLTVVPSYLHAVRSLSIIGAILLLFSTALGLYVATRKYNQSSRYVDNLLFGLLVSASVSLLSAMATFTGEHPTPYPTRYGYSFVLGWVSASLCLLLSAATFIGIYRATPM